MKIVRHKDSDFQGQIRQICAPSSLFDPTIEERTRKIVDEVAQGGDKAVAEFTRKFDGASLKPGHFEVTQSEIDAAIASAGSKLKSAVKFASENIAHFSRQSKRQNWTGENKQGGKVGEKYDPFTRVGIYVPGGTAPLVSTALMTITLANVAGCPEIVVCTPCDAEGKVNENLLYAAHMAGATEIYKIGGAQAVAAMAFGTRSISKVQKIFGPGNAYVVAAKRLLFGHVSIDLLPGPSEVLILADSTANPSFVAADMLAQAEHGSGHERVWMVTTSARLLRAVEKEIATQLPTLSRREYIEKALKNSYLIQVRSMEDAVALTNRLAPEHCEVMTDKAATVSRSITTAGAIFLGNYSPTVLGDYVAGPSHTLPTGGAGNSFPGLTVDQFQRRTSIVQYTQGALRKSIEAVEQFASMEGLSAHGRSAAIRLE